LVHDEINLSTTSAISCMCGTVLKKKLGTKTAGQMTKNRTQTQARIYYLICTSIDYK